MARSTPAMSPSDIPVDEVLRKATGARYDEALELMAIHRALSDAEPVVWAGRIIGFGEYEYRYESGHGGRAPLLGYAPGATKHTIYLTPDFATRWPDLLERLGPHTSSKACLYLTRLTGVDREALTELLARSRDLTLETYA